MFERPENDRPFPRNTPRVGAQKPCHVTASFRTSEVCNCYDVNVHCVRETLFSRNPYLPSAELDSWAVNTESY